MSATTNLPISAETKKAGLTCAFKPAKKPKGIRVNPKDATAAGKWSEEKYAETF